MQERKRGRRFVKEKSLRINLTIDKFNMDLIDLCCAKRNMNVSELFRTFAKEYAANVLNMDLNEFYYNNKIESKLPKKKEHIITNSFITQKQSILTEEQEREELERLKALRKSKKEGDGNFN